MEKCLLQWRTDQSRYVRWRSDAATAATQQNSNSTVTQVRKLSRSRLILLSFIKIAQSFIFINIYMRTLTDLEFS